MDHYKEWLSHSASDHQGENKQDGYLANWETGSRWNNKVAHKNWWIESEQMFWRRPDYLWHQ